MRFIDDIGVIGGLGNADHAISKLRKVGFGVFSRDSLLSVKKLFRVTGLASWPRSIRR